MNIVMAAVLIGIAIYVVLVRLHPSEMRRIADYCNSRADAEEWWAIRHREYRQQRAEREACQPKT